VIPVAEKRRYDDYGSASRPRSYALSRVQQIDRDDAVQQLNAMPTPSGGGTDRRQPNASMPAAANRAADWWA
jgi:hypothetical protein